MVLPKTNLLLFSNGAPTFQLTQKLPTKQTEPAVLRIDSGYGFILRRNFIKLLMEVLLLLLCIVLLPVERTSNT